VPYDPAFQDLLDERIKAALENRKIRLEDLPVAQLSDTLNDGMSPDGDTFLLPHSVGPDSLAALPFCQVSRVANQAIGSAVVVPLAFDTENWDFWNMHAPSSTTVTVPLDGVYAISAAGTIASPGVGGVWTWALQAPLNGVATGRLTTQVLGQAPAFNYIATISSYEYLTAGSTVSLTHFQNTGGALNATGALSVVYHCPLGR